MVIFSMWNWNGPTDCEPEMVLYNLLQIINDPTDCKS